jgi:hypothetical protein
VLPEPVVLEINALLPTAVFSLPSVSLCSAQAPTAVLSPPVVLELKADLPTATLSTVAGTNSAASPRIRRPPARFASPATSSLADGNWTPMPTLPVLATRNFELPPIMKLIFPNGAMLLMRYSCVELLNPWN